MKKLVLSCIALLSVVLFSACNDDQSAAGKADGTYMTYRVTDINRELSQGPMASVPFTPVQDQVKVVIESATENHINIVVPSLSYVFNGTQMTIPTFTIPNVPVLDAGEEGVFSPMHTYEITVDSKKVYGSVELDIDTDGEFDMELNIKYGNMPLWLNQEYSSIN